MYQTLSSVITDKQHQEAKALSSRLSDSMQRKRAYVEFTGVFFAIDYLASQRLRANTARSIFKCNRLYRDFQIADIYCNSHTLYVITTYGSSQIKIPVLHSKYEILPEAYLIVDLKIGMKEAEVKGAIFAEDLHKYENDGRYYKADFDKISPIEKLIEKLKVYTGIKPSIGRHLDCMNLFVPYVDSEISDTDKKFLIRHILSCETCKKSLIETIEFDETSKTITQHKPVIADVQETQKKPEQQIVTKEKFMSKIESPVKSDGESVKGAIDIIYNPEDFKGLKNEKIGFSSVADIPDNLKKMAAISVAVVFLLCALVVSATSLANRKNMPSKETQEYVEDTAYNQEENNGYDDFVAPKIDERGGYMTVSKVSWEVSSDIKSESQRNFLQQAGKTIRLNLQNDLLLSNQIAMSNKVKFDIRFLRDGSLDEVIVSKSSGSGAVDDMLRESVENTLRYMHPPKGAFVGNKNGLTLVVEF